MSIQWSPEALSDADRLVDFVAGYDPIRAIEIEQELQDAPKKLLHFRRMGSRLSEFDPLEIRELRVGKYLLRYEVAGEMIRVLRLFHGREDRF